MHKKGPETSQGRAETGNEKLSELSNDISFLGIEEKYLHNNALNDSVKEKRLDEIVKPNQKFCINIRGIEYNAVWKNNTYVYENRPDERIIIRGWEVLGPYKEGLKPAGTPVSTPSSITDKTKQDLQKTKDIVSVEAILDQATKNVAGGVDIKKTPEVSDAAKKASDKVQKAIKKAPKKIQTAAVKDVEENKIDMSFIKNIPGIGGFIAMVLKIIESISSSDLFSKASHKVKNVFTPDKKKKITPKTSVKNLNKGKTKSGIELNDSAKTKEKYKYLQEHAGKRTMQHIDKLKPNPDFRRKVIDFIHMSYKNGYPIIITSSVRSLATQKEYVKKGVAKTLNSQHLKYNAIDIMYKKGFKIPLKVRQFAAKCGIFSGAEMWGGWDEPHFQGTYTGKASKKKSVLKNMQARGTLPSGYDVNGNKGIFA